MALENVACTGSENTLLGCSSNAIFDTDCSHSEDAGVICEGTFKTYSILTFLVDIYNNIIILCNL